MSLLTNLTAYYNFNQSSGNPTDSSGNGLTLTNNGATFGSSYGIINNGLLFAAGNYLGSNSSSLFNTTSISYSAWVKTTDTTNPQKTIIINSTGGGGWQWYINYDGTHFQQKLDVQGIINIGTGNNNAALGSGSWTHIAVTYNSSTGALQFYTNGVADGSATNIQSQSYGAFQIGFNASNQKYIGDMDEVGVWSRILSSSEISQLYNGGFGLTYPFSGIMYWVGGTGNWDSSTTTNWAQTSGGTGSGPVPSTGNAVVFDLNSGSGTCTVTASQSVLSITSTGSTVTLNTNGQTVSSSRVITLGGTTNLGASNINSLSISNGGTTNLGSSTISLSGTGTVWSTTGTVVAGTSTIVISDTSSSSKTFSGSGLTYYNLTFTGGTGVHIITGSNTFNATTITTPPSTINFTAGTTQTVNAFNVTGSAGNLNILQSTSSGLAWYLASANQISIDYVSLQDSHALYL